MARPRDTNNHRLRPGHSKQRARAPLAPPPPPAYQCPAAQPRASTFPNHRLPFSLRPLAQRHPPHPSASRQLQRPEGAGWGHGAGGRAEPLLLRRWWRWWRRRRQSPQGHPNGSAGVGGGASPAGPGRAPAPGRAEHYRRRRMAHGARAARPPRAPLLAPGRAHPAHPHQGAPEAQAGGSVDGKTGLVRGLRQRGDPGWLPDPPEEPHHGAQVAARLAGERAAEVHPQEADGRRSDVCRGLPQTQQEDPVLVQALQSYWEAPLGATVRVWRVERGFMALLSE